MAEENGRAAVRAVPRLSQPRSGRARPARPQPCRPARPKGRRRWRVRLFAGAAARRATRASSGTRPGSTCFSPIRPRCFQACGWRRAASTTPPTARALVRFLVRSVLTLTVDAHRRCCNSARKEGLHHGSKTIAAWPRRRLAENAERGADRSRAEPAGRHELRRALCRAGIHRHVPGHRPAGFRASRDRLCAGPLAARVEVAETLSRELPQPCRASTRTAP